MAQPDKLELLATKFKHGGPVSVYDADAYLCCQRGTFASLVRAGKIRATVRPHGRKVRRFVEALEARRLYESGQAVLQAV